MTKGFIKIAPIELVSLLEFEGRLLDDLKALFQRLPAGIKGYIESDFSFKNADAADIQRLYSQPGSHAFTQYDETKKDKKICFDTTYFESSPDLRLAYFLHEICHYSAYSHYPGSAKILQVKGTIYDNFATQSKKLESDEIERIPEIILNKINYAYILSLVNETLADKLMIEIDEELYRRKLMAQLKEYHKRTIDDAPKIYIHIIDLLRSLDLVQGRRGYDQQIKELNELAEELQQKLDGKLMPEKIKILLGSIEELRTTIVTSDTVKILSFFEKMIGELSSFPSVFIASK